MTTNPGAYLCIRPRITGLAFLSYFMVFHQKSFSATTSVAKHDAMFLIIYIISGDVVPVTPAEPVPAVQVRGAGIRAVPEVPALHRESSYEGRSPLPLRGIHPRRPINRRRRSASYPSRARASSAGKRSRQTCRTRGSRPVNTLAFRMWL